eukprot:gene7899-12367_t
MVISSTTLPNQSSKVSLPFNRTTSVFEAPVIQELEDNHHIQHSEFSEILWNASKKYTKIQKRKSCCRVTCCCTTSILSIICLVMFGIALTSMIVLPKASQNLIVSKIRSSRAETLMVSGTPEKDNFILGYVQGYNQRKYFDKQPTQDELKQALNHYNPVYVKDVAFFNSELQKSLCDSLRRNKHATFIGGLSRYDKAQKKLVKRLLKCRKPSSHVTYIKKIPSFGWAMYGVKALIAFLFLTCSTVICCSCINTQTKEKLLKMEKELNKESMEVFLPRGVHFSFNSEIQSNPQIDVYLYGSNVNLNSKQQIAPLETSNYISQPIVQQTPVVVSNQPVQYSQTVQQQPVYYQQQVEEVQRFLYPNPHGNINNGQSYSTFPKQ